MRSIIDATLNSVNHRYGDTQTCEVVTFLWIFFANLWFGNLKSQ